MEKVKILFLGSGNIGVINILCENLKQYGSCDYQFDGLNLYKKGQGGVTNDYQYITNQYDINERNLRTIPPKLILKAVSNKKSLLLICKLLVLNILHPLRILEGIKKIIKDYDWQIRVLKKIEDYEIINIHFLSNWQARLVPLIPIGKRVVISIWGSDLMAMAGKEIYSLQFDALQRADAITLVSPELEQILLSKFGRNLESKVTQALFGQTQDIVDRIRSDFIFYRAKGNSLLENYKLNADDYEYIVKVGYSAFESQNHIPILDQMGRLDPYLRQKTLFIIPMAYGDTSVDYINQVISSINSNNLNGIVLKEYLSIESSIALSCLCNIMFNLRNNDAFNNSMTESLLAGALVFNGSWLPYKILKDKGVFYIEVDRISNLSGIFEQILSDFESQHKKASDNPKILDGFISGKENVQKWEIAYGKNILE